jgi:hypothetical protein
LEKSRNSLIARLVRELVNARTVRELVTIKNEITTGRQNATVAMGEGFAVNVMG